MGTGFGLSVIGFRPSEGKNCDAVWWVVRFNEDRNLGERWVGVGSRLEVGAETCSALCSNVGRSGQDAPTSSGRSAQSREKFIIYLKAITTGFCQPLRQQGVARRLRVDSKEGWEGLSGWRIPRDRNLITQRSLGNAISDIHLNSVRTGLCSDMMEY